MLYKGLVRPWFITWRSWEETELLDRGVGKKLEWIEENGKTLLLKLDCWIEDFGRNWNVG